MDGEEGADEGEEEGEALDPELVICALEEERDDLAGRLLSQSGCHTGAGHV